MVEINLSQQKHHFDQSDNQFDPDNILSPTLAQKLENQHVQKYILKLNPKKILDYGCGTGRMTMPILEKGIDVYAVDVSPPSLKILKRIYDKQKNKNWGKLYISTQIPHDLKVDAVIGSDILHHVNIRKTLPLLYRLLNKSGVAVFSEPNSFHLPWYVFIAMNRSWDIENGILQCSYPQFKNQFLGAGFREVNLKGHGLLPTRIFNQSPELCKLNAFVLSDLPIIKFFSFRFIIVAQK